MLRYLLTVLNHYPSYYIQGKQGMIVSRVYSICRFGLSAVSSLFLFQYPQYYKLICTSLHWQCHTGEWSRTQHTHLPHLWSTQECSRCQARSCSRTSLAARSYDTNAILPTVYSNIKKVHILFFWLKLGIG